MYVLISHSLETHCCTDLPFYMFPSHIFVTFSTISFIYLFSLPFQLRRLPTYLLNIPLPPLTPHCPHSSFLERSHGEPALVNAMKPDKFEGWHERQSNGVGKTIRCLTPTYQTERAKFVQPNWGGVLGWRTVYLVKFFILH